MDPSTSSMRKGCDGEKRGGEEEKNDENSGHLRRCQSTTQTPTVHANLFEHGISRHKKMRGKIISMQINKNNQLVTEGLCYKSCKI